MRPTVKNVNSDFNGIAAVQRECNTYTVCKAL
jgi:hypothetical protein